MPVDVSQLDLDLEDEDCDTYDSEEIYLVIGVIAYHST